MKKYSLYIWSLFPSTLLFFSLIAEAQNLGFSKIQAIDRQIAAGIASGFVQPSLERSLELATERGKLCRIDPSGCIRLNQLSSAICRPVLEKEKDVILNVWSGIIPHINSMNGAGAVWVTLSACSKEFTNTRGYAALLLLDRAHAKKWPDLERKILTWLTSQTKPVIGDPELLISAVPETLDKMKRVKPIAFDSIRTLAKASVSWLKKGDGAEMEPQTFSYWLFTVGTALRDTGDGVTLFGPELSAHFDFLISQAKQKPDHLFQVIEILCPASRNAWRQGECPRIVKRLYGDKPSLAARLQLAHTLTDEGKFAESLTMLNLVEKESKGVSTTEAQMALAITPIFQGINNFYLKKYDIASERIAVNLGIVKNLNDPLTESWGQIFRAKILRAQGRAAEAAGLIDQQRAAIGATAMGPIRQKILLEYEALLNATILKDQKRIDQAVQGLRAALIGDPSENLYREAIEVLVGSAKTLPNTEKLARVSATRSAVFPDVLDLKNALEQLK